MATEFTALRLTFARYEPRIATLCATHRIKELYMAALSNDVETRRPSGP